MEPPPVPKPAPVRVPRPLGPIVRAVALGLVTLGVYLANGREIGTYDTEPATMLTLTLARGEGLHLDRFGPTLYEPDGRLAPYVARSGRHLVSRYPVAPALLALPIAWPQYAYLDATRPGWDRDPVRARAAARTASKHAAAVLAALAVVVLDRLLRRLGFGMAGTAAALVAAFGSGLWSVGSQALWQHGPAVLMFGLALLALTAEHPGPGRLFLGGLATALMVACRAIDLVFALMLLGWVARRHPRGLVAFLPGPLVVGGLLLAWNLATFGTPTGGQAALEAMHPELHGVDSTWTANPLPGFLGTLFSPSRGLMVFCPWVALAVVALPWSWFRIPHRSAARWAVAGLLPYLALLSSYTVWWAGHTFGPRYWTDAVPPLAIALAAALSWASARARPVLVALALAVVWSVGVQLLGVTIYPTSWNLAPTNVDRDHARLWDWKDTELRRCLTRALGRRGPDGG
jgi:hypothetical protein